MRSTILAWMNLVIYDKFLKLFISARYLYKINQKNRHNCRGILLAFSREKVKRMWRILCYAIRCKIWVPCSTMDNRHVTKEIRGDSGEARWSGLIWQRKPESRRSYNYRLQHDNDWHVQHCIRQFKCFKAVVLLRLQYDSLSRESLKYIIPTVSIKLILLPNNWKTSDSQATL